MNKNDKKLQKQSVDDIKIKELLEQLDKTINPFSSSKWKSLNFKKITMKQHYFIKNSMKN